MSLGYDFISLCLSVCLSASSSSITTLSICIRILYWCCCCWLWIYSQSTNYEGRCKLDYRTVALLRLFGEKFTLLLLFIDDGVIGNNFSWGHHSERIFCLYIYKCPSSNNNHLVVSAIYNAGCCLRSCKFIGFVHRLIATIIAACSSSEWEWRTQNYWL